MKKFSSEIHARFNGNEIEMCICNSIISFTKLFRPCCLGVGIDCASFSLSPTSNSSIVDCIIWWWLTFNLPFLYYAMSDWLKSDWVTANTSKKKKKKKHEIAARLKLWRRCWCFSSHFIIYLIFYMWQKRSHFVFACGKNQIINCRTEEKKYFFASSSLHFR